MDRKLMKRRIAIAVIIVAALVILLFPIRIAYKDGGSVEYKALTYSVTKYHRMPPIGSDDYLEGWKIELFGITLRDDLAYLKY